MKRDNRKPFKLIFFDKWITAIILFGFSFVFLLAYVFLALELIKIIVFILGFTAIILLKTKKVYFLMLLSSFSMILVLKKINIGSLFTWLLIIYYASVLFDRIIRKDFNDILSQRTIICFILCLFLLISFLLNFQTAEFSKTISLIVYLLSPVFLCIDPNFPKNAPVSMSCLTISFFLSNLFAFSFVYILKDRTVDFLSLVLPKWLKYYQMNNGSFRFSGLNDDPNYNSFLSIFLASLCLLASINETAKKQRWFLILLSIVIQPFAILGMSKTYLITMCVFILYLIIIAFVVFKIDSIYIPVSLFAFSLLSIPLVLIFSSTILRIFSGDTRIGVISSLTTGRSDLFTSYLSELASDPLRLLIGHGAHANPIESLNDMHNTILRIVWDCGLIGAIPYCTYFISFLYFKPANINNAILKIGPLLLFFIYTFALDLASNHIVIFSIFVFSVIDILPIKERIKDLFYEVDI